MAYYASAPMFNKDGHIGSISFKQPQGSNKPVEIRYDFIRNLDEGTHAVQIRQYGNITNILNRNDTGEVYNPKYESDPQGWLEDVNVPRSGKRNMFLTPTTKISLVEQTAGESIIGRAVLVYTGTEPEIGDPIAWGVIGHVKPF